jgi:formate dehydrogenase subunit beta
METILPVENGDTLKAIQGFLKKLLETGTLDVLLVPMRTPGGAIVPALVSSPALLSQADPLAPVLPVNSATIAGKLSSKEAGSKVGVVLRACELRALVELVKLQQAHLENLTLIALDCAGTYSVPVYQRKAAEAAPGGAELWRGLFQEAAMHPETPDPVLRRACQICEQPVFDGATISIYLLGSDLNKEIRMALPDELATRLELNPAEVNGRSEVVERLVAARKTLLEAELAAMQTRIQQEGLANIFATCIRCHNCMTVCPICYCKTCVFKSAIFDHEPGQYVNWARAKGAYRLPSDTMLFHLTRLNHMVLSCVGCGMCSEACPAELPVGIVFRTTGGRVQACFEYQPGRNLAEPLPLVTFQADEWTEVGE